MTLCAEVKRDRGSVPAQALVQSGGGLASR